MYGSRPLPFFVIPNDGRWGQQCAYQSLRSHVPAAEVIVDAGKKATPYQATIGDD